MSCSKLLPPFTFDVLCCLKREQLERFSIVCRPLKKFIQRYFKSKPYRVFDILYIRGGAYALAHNFVQWHPNRNDYTAQQFLAGQQCVIGYRHYPFAQMRLYLGPTVRIKATIIFVAGDSIYNSDHIAEMESITYLWRNGDVSTWNSKRDDSLTVAEDFRPILNSPTILQCRDLSMDGAHFSYKDYNVLYTVQVIRDTYEYEDIDSSRYPSYWPQFLEQPGIKPVVVLRCYGRKYITNILDRLSKAFSSAVVPNPFKLVCSICGEVLTEFREMNKTSFEKLELKKGIPIGYERLDLKYNVYTLERSSF